MLDRLTRYLTLRLECSEEMLSDELFVASRNLFAQAVAWIPPRPGDAVSFSVGSGGIYGPLRAKGYGQQSGRLLAYGWMVAVTDEILETSGVSPGDIEEVSCWCDRIEPNGRPVWLFQLTARPDMPDDAMWQQWRDVLWPLIDRPLVHAPYTPYGPDRPYYLSPLDWPDEYAPTISLD